MHKALPNFFIFLDHFNSQIFKNNNINIGIIYRNYNTEKRETFGHSTIISPDGKILKLKKSGIGIVYADIKPNLSMQLRKIIPSLN